MSFLKYSVVASHYNQYDRIPYYINHWMSQTIPPEEIIIVDDGSPKKPISFDNVRIIQRPERTRNICQNYNMGINAVETSIYFESEISVFPYHKNFAELQLQRLKPKIRNLPIYAKATGTFEKFDIYNYRLWGFDNTLIYNPEVIQLIHDQQDSQSYEILSEYHSPCSACTFMYKEDFLQYNEMYDGWGLGDIDHAFRWKINGNKVFGYRDMLLVHLDHPRNDPSFYAGGDSRNRNLFNFCISYYQKNNITYMSPEIEEEIKKRFYYTLA